MPARSYNMRHRRTTSVGNPDTSKTRQSMAQQCDVNNIVAKFTRTGTLEHINTRTPHYGDMTAFDDLHAAINRVDQAFADFDALPSAVRAAAKNDPLTLLEMLATPEGHEALKKAENPRYWPDTLPAPEKPAEAPPAPPTDKGENPTKEA